LVKKTEVAVLLRHALPTECGVNQQNFFARKFKTAGLTIT
jgi:hypothetical protein